MHAQGIAYRGDDGRVIRLIGIQQDITERKRAEEALRQSEERFRAIYENAPVLIDAFDESGRCVLWNQECRRTFGWTIEEVTGHDDALELFYPDPLVRDEVKRTVTTDPDGHFREWHPITKDGKVLSTMWANFRLPDGLAFSLGYDITERKQAEEALRQSEALYHNLVETSQDLIWRCDSEGRFAYVNPAWEREVGYAVSAMLGHPFTEFLSTEVSDRDMAEFRSHLEGGEVRGHETVYLSKSGERTYLVFNAIPLYDDEGHIVGTQGTAHNITERKRAEEALHENEVRLSLLLKTVPVSVVVHDSSGRIIHHNPAADQLLASSDTTVSEREFDDEAWTFFQEDGTALTAYELPVKPCLDDEDTGRESSPGCSPSWNRGSRVGANECCTRVRSRRGHDAGHCYFDGHH